MEIIFLPHIREVIEEMELLKRRLKVDISIKNNLVKIQGPSLEEYEASKVFEAIAFGYPVRTALLLKDEEIVFQRLSIRDFTRRKNLEVVKSRIIGTQGRTKNTIENLSDCKIIIKDNEVGILCNADELEYTITAITNLIRGSKQSNIYKFLERVNTQKRKLDEEDEE